MPSYSGKIVSVSTKAVNTKFGSKPTYSFKAENGEWYKTGFKDPKVGSGTVVSFDYEVGKYGNEVDMGSFSIDGVAPVTSVPKSITPAPVSHRGTFPIPPLDGSRSIVRQNALTNARELVCTLISTHMQPDGKIPDGKLQNKLAERIVEIARIFEAYSCGDTELAEVKAEQEHAE